MIILTVTKIKTLIMAGYNHKFQNKIEDLDCLRKTESDRELFRGKASPVPVLFFAFLLFVLVKSCVM